MLKNSRHPIDVKVANTKMHLKSSQNEALYEKTTDIIVDLVWSSENYSLTIGQLLYLYYKKEGSPMPLCGYDDEVQLIQSMVDMITVIQGIRKPSLVCFNVSNEALKRANGILPGSRPEMDNEMRSSVGASKNSTSNGQVSGSKNEKVTNDDSLNAVKANIRAIFISSGLRQMTWKRLSDDYILLMKTGLPLLGHGRPSDLFDSMPDVLRKNNHFYELVPSEKSAAITKLVNETHKGRKVKTINPKYMDSDNKKMTTQVVETALKIPSW